MANKTHLKIMTPQGIFFDKDIAIVTVKTTEGYIGLQHGKSPFVASLDIAEMTITAEQGGKKEECAIAGGLVYVTPLLGGYLADKYLGARKTIMWGAFLMAAGYFLLASQHLIMFYIYIHN